MENRGKRQMALAILLLTNALSYENYDLLADLVNDKNSSQDFPEWSTFMMNRLLKNASFKLAFRQRFENLLNTTFSTPHLMHHINAMKTLYEIEVITLYAMEYAEQH